MHVRGWIIGAVVGLASTAGAEPAPKPVDVEAVKSQGLVLRDAQGGVYVVFWSEDPKAPKAPRVFYGPNTKAVYEQRKDTWSRPNKGGDWEIDTDAPRVPGGHASLMRQKDGTYQKICGYKRNSNIALSTGLTELSGEKAREMLDKTPFLSEGIVRVPHLLARDDSGVYYYVDGIAELYGGKGYRVFVGRKGAMKPMPLVDVASDTAGEVFSTKSGDLRLVRSSEDNKQRVTWIKGEKRTELVFLDADNNSVVIFKDLGIYGFLGTLCDDA